MLGSCPGLKQCYAHILIVLEHIIDEREPNCKTMAFFSTKSNSCWEGSYFEDLSSSFQLGVMANDLMHGRCLLHLTRFLVDGTSSLFFDEMVHQHMGGLYNDETFDEELRDVSVERRVQTLAQNEGVKVLKFPFDRKFFVQDEGGQRGTTYPDEVEWYTATRLRREYQRLYESI